MKEISKWRTVVLGCVGAVCAVSTGQARHVVLVVFDGMRPDFISEAKTPTLSRLAHDGVFFQNHHSVFLSSTEVNGTALATGMYPAHSGLMANVEYHPAIDPRRAVATESLETVRKGDALTHGHYLAVPTFVETLQAAGKTTTIAGSKAIALLFDRAERGNEASAVELFEGKSLPARVSELLVQNLGPFPEAGKQDKLLRDDWTTRGLVEKLWEKGMPDLTVLWLAEPDFSQHATGPGSEASLRAIKNSDQNLALVLKAIEERHQTSDTDVLVVSDHAFSTIERTVDLGQELSKAGWTTARAFTSEPAVDTLLVVGNGNVACIYVIGHKAETIRSVTRWFQQQDFTGVVFTRQPVPGAFTLAQAHIDTPDAPDLVVSLRWRADSNVHGVPGLAISEGSARKPGQGNHSSLSRFDVHNTLIAAGPDFRHGWTDTLPSANVDLAPTILKLLGVPSPHTLDGRVLTEALADEKAPAGKVSSDRWEARVDLDSGTWSQYLSVSEVNGVRYLDEGNGAFVPTGH